jgi:hypothetical protein
MIDKSPSFLAAYNTLSLQDGIISQQDRLNEASLDTFNHEDEVRIEETHETLEDDYNENTDPNKIPLNRDLDSNQRI